GVHSRVLRSPPKGRARTGSRYRQMVPSSRSKSGPKASPCGMSAWVTEMTGSSRPSYYPVLLDLRGRRAVVIGGGTGAEGKVGPLIDAGADVPVIAPLLTAGLSLMVREGKLVHLERQYAVGDLIDAHIAIAATDDPEVNHAVDAEAEDRRIPINVVDDPTHCSFILPSIMRQGDLVVAVSTSGNAPALAVRIRERLERGLGEEDGQFLWLAGAIRGPLAGRFPDFQIRKRLWYRLVDSDVLALLRAGDDSHAQQRIAEIMGVEVPAEPAHNEGRSQVRAAGTTTPLAGVARFGHCGTVY